MLASSVPLGPFLVDGAGRLAFRHSDTTRGFGFLWRANRCRVRLGGGTLSFTAVIGRLPSTAGGGGQREAALGVLRAVGKVLPAGWRLRLLADHRVQVEVEQALNWPTSMAALLTPVVRLVFCVAPLMELMREAGM